MPTLSQQEIAELDALRPTDLQTFTTQDAIDYYTYLEGKGFDYATLALAVVQDATGRGAAANAYSSSVASSEGINFSVGGGNWKEVQYELIHGDWTRRNADRKSTRLNSSH